MNRTQIYLTDEQQLLLRRRAADAGTSKAEVIRRILDASLGLTDGRSDELAAIRETSGVWADRIDGDVLTELRGRSAARRLDALGL